jgi:hypothetical protein
MKRATLPIITTRGMNSRVQAYQSQHSRARVGPGEGGSIKTRVIIIVLVGDSSLILQLDQMVI